MRSLWILRLNAAVREHGLNYSNFINGLSKAKIELNRKMLSEMAIKDPNSFKVLVDIAKKNLSAN
jgi:large subunit ribosomal protein L20